mmetsp:Transcript_3193/g.9319  ORF Transcript_3193/g.9319 Transcript_3193/m.9319 type:complete len:100 (-) Transcript_3193:105-404(-)
MKFQDLDHRMTIPDLRAPNGYAYFWVKEAASVAIVMILLYIHFKLGTRATVRSATKAFKVRCTWLKASIRRVLCRKLLVGWTARLKLFESDGESQSESD